jgi:hypothetical protein
VSWCVTKKGLASRRMKTSNALIKLVLAQGPVSLTAQPALGGILGDTGCLQKLLQWCLCF